MKLKEPVECRSRRTANQTSGKRVSALQWVILLVLLTGLACGSQSAVEPRITRIGRLPLPTLTPTAGSDQSVVEISPTATPIATAGNAAPAATVVHRAPTAEFDSAGWSFASLQVYDDQSEGGLLLYGDVINNTGATQELYYISGTFTDTRGQVVADKKNTDDFWPFEIVLPGERMPFGMSVNGIDSVADFKLNVSADPSEETPLHDFNFLDTRSALEGAKYCITGRFQNMGEPLQYSLIIVAVLYDAQDNIVNFKDLYDSAPEAIWGDKTLDFKLCADDFDREIARYELRAWGE